MQTVPTINVRPRRLKKQKNVVDRLDAPGAGGDLQEGARGWNCVGAIAEPAAGVGSAGCLRWPLGRQKRCAFVVAVSW